MSVTTKTPPISNLSLPSMSRNSNNSSNSKSPRNTKQDRGRLIATILSTYDLPQDLKPMSVKLEIGSIGQSVETGPPLSRHKDKNAFKFISSKENQNGNNELVIDAPLPKLYTSTATFRVMLEGLTPDLVCEVELSSALRVNETQWLILNLSTTTEFSTGANSSESSELQPTLRLKLRLEGEYRPEISAIVSAATAYFRTMDHIGSAANSTFQSLTVALPSKLPSAKFLLVPAVPIATACVALSPVLLGVLVVGLPFFLPLLVLLLAITLAALTVSTTLYLSTGTGRLKVLEFLQPLYSTFLITPSGQRFLYNTGPRPTPKQLVGLFLPTEMMPKLIVSLCIDFIGSSSYLLPIVGEAFDFAWAPIQTIMVASMYDATTPSLKYISFMEEILPFTDVVPTATMGWVKEFSPALLEQTKGVGHELGVVLRREKAGLKEMGLGRR